LSDGTTRKIAVADDKTKSVPKDAKLVSLEDREVAYWTLKFGVTQAAPGRRTIKKVGRSAMEAVLRTEPAC
jgi:hypothetical protein